MLYRLGGGSTLVQSVLSLSRGLYFLWGSNSFQQSLDLVEIFNYRLCVCGKFRGLPKSIVHFLVWNPVGHYSLRILLEIIPFFLLPIDLTSVWRAILLWNNPRKHERPLVCLAQQPMASVRRSDPPYPTIASTTTGHYRHLPRSKRRSWGITWNKKKIPVKQTILKNKIGVSRSLESVKWKKDWIKTNPDDGHILVFDWSHVLVFDWSWKNDEKWMKTSPRECLRRNYLYNF